jgi:hypothetical protein
MLTFSYLSQVEYDLRDCTILHLSFFLNVTNAEFMHNQSYIIVTFYQSRCVYFQTYAQIVLKIRNGPRDIIRGPGKTDS